MASLTQSGPGEQREHSSVVGESLDDRTHLLRVNGDPVAVTSKFRALAAGAIAVGRRVLIVDLGGATRVEGPLAWELSRASERMSWRGGRLIVASGGHDVDGLFEAFALHRPPDVVTTVDDALAAAGGGAGP